MSRRVFTVIDVETTGFEPPAEVIEIGFQDVILEHGAARLGNYGSRLFGAERGIPPETMAVHHITPAQIAGLPLFGSFDLEELLHDGAPGAYPMAANDGAPPDALVAHNAAFEAQWFTPALICQTPLICTLKAASRVWPEAPSHSNSVLRYWLDLRLDDDRAMPPHRAGPDAFVTAHILMRLLDHATVEQMIAWTAEPRVMPRINFGKHKGAAWPDAPRDYLEWLLRSDMDGDTKWNAQRELSRRKTGVAA